MSGRKSLYVGVIWAFKCVYVISGSFLAVTAMGHVRNGTADKSSEQGSLK